MGVFRPWAAVEALADDAPGVDMVKIGKIRFVKKITKKGSDVELWRESTYDSSGIDLRTGLYVLWLHIVYVDHTRGTDSKKTWNFAARM